MNHDDETRPGAERKPPLERTEPQSPRSQLGSDDPTLPVEPDPRPTIGEAPNTGASILGRSRIGDYRLLRELGQGGQGAVFLAEHARLGRKVALKVLLPDFRPSPQSLRRFEREAEVASRLAHPGICTVYEMGEDEGMPFIAMEYVAGSALDRKIKEARSAGKARNVALSASSSSGREAGEDGKGRDANRSDDRSGLRGTLRFIEEAARALHVAHEAGLVHRDIKPANIIAADDGRAVVLDFGLARDDSTVGEALTQSDAVMGTPAYMAPEQVRGDQRAIDRRSDVYALGLTLYECVTLDRPFQAPTRDALYQQIMTVEAPPPRLKNATLPRDLEVVILTALEKNPDRRYQTALDFAEDLRRVRRFEPILARPAGPLLRFGRWAQRNPRVAVLAALLLASASVFVSMLTMKNRELRAGNRALASKTDEADRNAREAERQARVATERANDLERSSRALREESYARAIAAAERALADKDLAGARVLLADAPDELRGWEWRHLDLATRNRDAAQALAMIGQGSADQDWRLFPCGPEWVIRSDEGVTAIQGHMRKSFESRTGRDASAVGYDSVYSVAGDRLDVYDTESSLHSSIEITGPDRRGATLLGAAGRVILVTGGSPTPNRIFAVEKTKAGHATRLLGETSADFASVQAAISSDGSQVALCSPQRLYRFDLDGGRDPVVVDADVNGDFGWCGFHVDGSLMVSIYAPGADWESRVLDPATGRLVTTQLDIIDDPRTRMGSGWLCRIDSSTGSVVLERDGEADTLLARGIEATVASYGNRAKRLAVGLANGDIEIWTLTPPRLLLRLHDHVQAIADLAWNELDGSLAAIDAGGQVTRYGDRALDETLFPSFVPIAEDDPAPDPRPVAELGLADYQQRLGSSLSRFASSAAAERHFRARRFLDTGLPRLATETDPELDRIAARIAPLIENGAEEIPSELFGDGGADSAAATTILQRFPSTQGDESIVIAGRSDADDNRQFLVFRESGSLSLLGSFEFDHGGGNYLVVSTQGADFLRLDFVVGRGTGTMLETSTWNLLGRDGMRPVLEFPIQTFVAGWGMPFDRFIDGRSGELFELDGLPAISVVLRAVYRANGNDWSGAESDFPSGMTIFESRSRVTWQWDPVTLAFRVLRDCSDLGQEGVDALYSEDSRGWLERNIGRLRALARDGEAGPRRWAEAAVGEYDRLLRAEYEKR